MKETAVVPRNLQKVAAKRAGGKNNQILETDKQKIPFIENLL